MVRRNSVSLQVHLPVNVLIGFYSTVGCALCVLFFTLRTYSDLSHSMSISPLPCPCPCLEAEADPLVSFPLLELDPALV